MINARFIKPIDKNLLAQVVASGARLLTVEDHQKAGGFGSAVLEALQELNLKPEIEILALPDRFFEHGSIGRLHHEAGIDAEAIKERLLAWQKSPTHALP